MEHLKVKKGQKYAIVRFVSWEAHHDIGQHGFSLQDKEKAIHDLAKYITVFISSEKPLPESLEKFRIHIPIEKMHDALAFAHLYLGEGGTTATEAALLGTPNIIINSLAKHCGTHIELRDKYRLQYFYDKYLITPFRGSQYCKNCLFFILMYI